MSDSSCPVQEQGDRDDRRLFWDRKAFYVVKIPQVFGLPNQVDRIVEKAMQDAQVEGYQIPPRPMVLTKKGLFHGEVLVEISGVVAPGGNVRVFNDVPVYTSRTQVSLKELKKKAKEFSRNLHEKGIDFSEVYFWCQGSVESKVNHHNTVLLAFEGY